MVSSGRMNPGRELTSHPLLEALFENVRPLVSESATKLKELAEKTGKIRQLHGRPLTEAEFYDTTAFRHAHALLNCVCRLENIRKFIGNFPSPRMYEKRGISRYIWIEYHYSNYVVTLVTLGDLCLVLINTVFRLGNPEKLCKADIIKNNDWVKRAGVSKKLQSLEKIIERHRSIRTLFIHRGKPPELHEIFGSDVLDYLKLVDFVHLHAEPIIDRRTLNLAYRGEISKICDEMDAEILKVKKAMWPVLDSILPIYESSATALRK